MKKCILYIIFIALILSVVGCKNSDRQSAITVISREDGSGTKSAFESIFGIEETTVNAEITNSTAVMINTVMGDKNSIGYISLGSINKNVKNLKVDGAECSAENIKNGSYKIFRDLNVVTGSKLSDIAKDFLEFALSRDGQKIVESSGYVSIDSESGYNSKDLTGEITLVGSSSVAPVVEKLKEAYLKLNPKSSIEIQQNDSTTGVSSVLDGIGDIGMVSRELKTEESEKGLTVQKIATDGIAVIVNKENSCDGLCITEINKIFSGIITNWNELRY